MFTVNTVLVTDSIYGYDPLTGAARQTGLSFIEKLNMNADNDKKKDVPTSKNEIITDNGYIVRIQLYYVDDFGRFNLNSTYYNFVTYLPVKYIGIDELNPAGNDYFSNQYSQYRLNPLY